jgi:hypothetical protein
MMKPCLFWFLEMMKQETRTRKPKSYHQKTDNIEAILNTQVHKTRFQCWKTVADELAGSLQKSFLIRFLTGIYIYIYIYITCESCVFCFCFWFLVLKKGKYRLWHFFFGRTFVTWQQKKIQCHTFKGFFGGQMTQSRHNSEEKKLKSSDLDNKFKHVT